MLRHARRQASTSTLTLSVTTRRWFSISGVRRIEQAEGFRTGEGVWLNSPRDVVKHLDNYIVGQDRAKKILSVAVYNHYHRITHLRQQASRQEEKLNTTGQAEVLEAEEAIPESVIPIVPKERERSGRRKREVVEDEREIRIEVGAVEPDPTKIHEASHWTGRNFYTRAFPPEIVEDEVHHSHPHSHPSSSPSRRQSTLLGRISTAFSPSSPEPQQQSSGSKPTRRRPKGSVGEKGRAGMEGMGYGSGTVQGQDGQAGVGGATGMDEVEDDVEIDKANVLMLGPTGSGKTLLAKTLARILDVPFASSDATSFTQAGYVGDDVENAVLRLLKQADYDVARTEIGIIHIDEVDKLARRGGGGDGGSWGGRDVGGEGVQQALLKLLEGTTLNLQAKPPPQAAAPPPSMSFNNTTMFPQDGSSGPGRGEQQQQGKKGIKEGLPQHGAGGGANGKGEIFNVDTTNILFILSGAFVGLENIISRRIGKGSIGFNAVLPERKKDTNDDDSGDAVDASSEKEQRERNRLNNLTNSDLVEYGFIPEFIGRLPVLAPLHPLSLSELMRILVEPKNAIIKQQRKLFSRWGCDLRFSNSAIQAIAKEAAKRGGSARHLKSVISDILLEANYESPSSSVRYAAVTAAVVQREVPVLYFSRGQQHLFQQALADDDAPPQVESNQGGWDEDGDQGSMHYYPTNPDLDMEPEPARAFGSGKHTITGKKPSVYNGVQHRSLHTGRVLGQQAKKGGGQSPPQGGKRPATSPKSTKRRQRAAAQDLRANASPTRGPELPCIAYTTAEKYDLNAVAAVLRKQGARFHLAFENESVDQALVVSQWNTDFAPLPFAQRPNDTFLGSLTGGKSQTAEVEETDSSEASPDFGHGRDGEIWVLQSGSFVTWGLSASEGKTFLREVIRAKNSLVEGGRIPDPDVQTEEVDFIVDVAEETRIKGNLILLGSPPVLHSFQHSPAYASLLTRYTFSVALARSSALAAVEARLNAHLDKVIKVPRLLESTGTQPLKRKEVIRNIGELMLLREAVNFRGGGLEDTPEIYWSEPQLEAYFDAVSTEFEIEDRIETLNQKIDYASEVQSTLRALLTEASGHRMEVIIIALIAVEVVLALSRELPEYMHLLMEWLSSSSSIGHQFLFPTAIAAMSAKACTAPSAARNTAPIAYHILRKPVPYQVGLDLQNAIIEARLKAKKADPTSPLALQDVVLLLEHVPVYTTGRRDGSPNPDTLHPEEQKIQNVGADFHITKRGGQVTFHGPGQLVGYPLFDLNAMELSTRCYVSYLQDILARYAAEASGKDVLAPHPDGHLASIGIHLRHRITSHGFAINIDNQPLKWFDLVTACGLADVRATSLAKVAGRSDFNAKLTAKQLMPYFANKFDREMRPLDDLRTTNEGADIIARIIDQAEQRIKQTKIEYPSEPHTKAEH